MLRLNSQQRAALGETVRELANLAAAAFILGQFVGAKPVSWWLLLAGAGLWITFVLFAVRLIGEE